MEDSKCICCRKPILVRKAGDIMDEICIHCLPLFWYEYEVESHGFEGSYDEIPKP